MYAAQPTTLLPLAFQLPIYLLVRSSWILQHPMYTEPMRFCLLLEPLKRLSDWLPILGASKK